MELEVICPAELMPVINSDLTRRRATLEGFDTRGNDKVGLLLLGATVFVSETLRTRVHQQ